MINGCNLWNYAPISTAQHKVNAKSAKSLHSRSLACTCVDSQKTSRFQDAKTLSFSGCRRGFAQITFWRNPQWRVQEGHNGTGDLSVVQFMLPEKSLDAFVMRISLGFATKGCCQFAEIDGFDSDQCYQKSCQKAQSCAMPR